MLETLQPLLVRNAAVCFVLGASASDLADTDRRRREPHWCFKKFAVRRHLVASPVGVHVRVCIADTDMILTRYDVASRAMEVATFPTPEALTPAHTGTGSGGGGGSAYKRSPLGSSSEIARGGGDASSAVTLIQSKSV